MPRFRYTLIDVFAARPLAGNLLAVIEDTDTIDDDTMATLARRFRLSETSFIQTATSPTADYRHRIFIVEGEIPFAGHPSLGTAAVWAHRRGLAEADLMQQTISGEQRLHVVLRGTSGTADIWQNPAEFGEAVDAAPIVGALGLDPAAHPSLQPQVVSTGLPTLIVPLADPVSLGAIRLDSQRLAAKLPTLANGSQPVTCYVVAEASPGEWRARSFGAGLAGGEDPATGSAAGPLGAQLASNNSRSPRGSRCNAQACSASTPARGSRSAATSTSSAKACSTCRDLPTLRGRNSSR
jgi:trans-2,3-dihydro-3-hydroxyanthranilate isomerase